MKRKGKLKDILLPILVLTVLLTGLLAAQSQAATVTNTFGQVTLDGMVYQLVRIEEDSVVTSSYAHAQRVADTAATYNHLVVRSVIPAGTVYTPSGGGSATLAQNITVTRMQGIHSSIKIKEVTIPGTIASIPTFYDNDTLEKVNLGDGVKAIGMNAFTYCDNLKSINIPATVTSIQPSAFSHCSSLETVTFEAGATGNIEISNNAFSNCVSLKSVDLRSVTAFGYGAFQGCTSLIGVVLSENLRYMDAGVFQYCSNLTTVEFLSPTRPVGNGVGYGMIGSGCFFGINQNATFILPQQTTAADYETYTSSLINTGSPFGVTVMRKGMVAPVPPTISAISATGFVSGAGTVGNPYIVAEEYMQDLRFEVSGSAPGATFRWGVYRNTNRLETDPVVGATSHTATTSTMNLRSGGAAGLYYVYADMSATYPAWQYSGGHIARSISVPVVVAVIPSVAPTPVFADRASSSIWLANPGQYKTISTYVEAGNYPGVYKYQWYKSADGTVASGVLIYGASGNMTPVTYNGKTYYQAQYSAPPPAANAVGRTFYFCRVTNDTSVLGALACPYGATSSAFSTPRAVDHMNDGAGAITITKTFTTAHTSAANFMNLSMNSLYKLEVDASPSAIPLTYGWSRGTISVGTGKSFVIPTGEATPEGAITPVMMCHVSYQAKEYNLLTGALVASRNVTVLTHPFYYKVNSTPVVRAAAPSISKVTNGGFGYFYARTAFGLPTTAAAPFNGNYGAATFVDNTFIVPRGLNETISAAGNQGVYLSTGSINYSFNASDRTTSRMDINYYKTNGPDNYEGGVLVHSVTVLQNTAIGAIPVTDYRLDTAAAGTAYYYFEAVNYMPGSSSTLTSNTFRSEIIKVRAADIATTPVSNDVRIVGNYLSETGGPVYLYQFCANEGDCDMAEIGEALQNQRKEFPMRFCVVIENPALNAAQYSLSYYAYTEGMDRSTAIATGQVYQIGSTENLTCAVDYASIFENPYICNTSLAAEGFCEACQGQGYPGGRHWIPVGEYRVYAELTQLGSSGTPTVTRCSTDEEFELVIRNTNYEPIDYPTTINIVGNLYKTPIVFLCSEVAKNPFVNPSLSLAVSGNFNTYGGTTLDIQWFRSDTPTYNGYPIDDAEYATSSNIGYPLAYNGWASSMTVPHKYANPQHGEYKFSDGYYYCKITATNPTSGKQRIAYSNITPVRVAWNNDVTIPRIEPLAFSRTNGKLPARLAYAGSSHAYHVSTHSRYMVTAQVSKPRGDAEISYQWYRISEQIGFSASTILGEGNILPGGSELLEGASGIITTADFEPGSDYYRLEMPVDTSADGVWRYFLHLRVHEPSAIDHPIGQAISNPSDYIVVNSTYTSAQEPVIITQPNAGGAYLVSAYWGDATEDLPVFTVEADVSDGGTLEYLWRISFKDKNGVVQTEKISTPSGASFHLGTLSGEGNKGTPYTWVNYVDDITDPGFLFDVSVWCEVTNTITGGGSYGEKAVTVATAPATYRLYPLPRIVAGTKPAGWKNTLSLGVDALSSQTVIDKLTADYLLPFTLAERTLPGAPEYPTDLTYNIYSRVHYIDGSGQDKSDATGIGGAPLSEFPISASMLPGALNTAASSAQHHDISAQMEVSFYRSSGGSEWWTRTTCPIPDVLVAVTLVAGSNIYDVIGGGGAAPTVTLSDTLINLFADDPANQSKIIAPAYANEASLVGWPDSVTRSYQWQLFNDLSDKWEDISGATSETLEVTAKRSEPGALAVTEGSSHLIRLRTTYVNNVIAAGNLGQSTWVLDSDGVNIYVYEAVALPVFRTGGGVTVPDSGISYRVSGQAFAIVAVADVPSGFRVEYDWYYKNAAGGNVISGLSRDSDGTTGVHTLSAVPPSRQGDLWSSSYRFDERGNMILELYCQATSYNSENVDGATAVSGPYYFHVMPLPELKTPAATSGITIRKSGEADSIMNLTDAAAGVYTADFTWDYSGSGAEYTDVTFHWYLGKSGVEYLLESTATPTISLTADKLLASGIQIHTGAQHSLFCDVEFSILLDADGNDGTLEDQHLATRQITPTPIWAYIYATPKDSGEVTVKRVIASAWAETTTAHPGDALRLSIDGLEFGTPAPRTVGDTQYTWEYFNVPSNAWCNVDSFAPIKMEKNDTDYPAGFDYLTAELLSASSGNYGNITDNSDGTYSMRLRVKIFDALLADTGAFAAVYTPELTLTIDTNAVNAQTPAVTLTKTVPGTENPNGTISFFEPDLFIGDVTNSAELAGAVSYQWHARIRKGANYYAANGLVSEDGENTWIAVPAAGYGGNTLGPIEISGQFYYTLFENCEFQYRLTVTHVDNSPEINGSNTASTSVMTPFTTYASPSYTMPGVPVSGQVRSYNPKNAVTIELRQGGTAIYATTIAAEATGSGQVTQSFTFTDVVAGTYDLMVSKNVHLTATISGVVVDGSNVDLTEHTLAAIKVITLLVGDTDGNGSINVTDFNYVLNDFGKADGAVSGKTTDFTGEGSVNVTDFNLILNNFGKTAPLISY